MKPTLIVLVVGLLAVGCLTPEQKQKALRDSVVGAYKCSVSHFEREAKKKIQNHLDEQEKLRKKILNMLQALKDPKLGDVERSRREQLVAGQQKLFQETDEAIRDFLKATKEIIPATTAKFVFLENGMVEAFENGKKQSEEKWKLAGKEVHVLGDVTGILKIEPNGDLTEIAYIEDGKRKDFPKNYHYTYKKIK